MKNSETCCNCGRPIRRSGPGSGWWHIRTASSSCYPGAGSWRKVASPVEVTVKEEQ